MPNLLCNGVILVGLSACVPKQRVDNLELAPSSDKAKEEIVEQVGIRYRHIATPGQTASDLCEAATSKLIEKLSWNLEDIGMLIFVSQTPDYLVPGTATQLQERIGLPQSTMVLDINQGCAGYVYGLSVASGLMKAYGIKKGLLLVGDTITNMISKEDNSLNMIFADAGSATALMLDGSETEMAFQLGSNGKDFKAIHVPEGGAREPLSADSLLMKKHGNGIVKQANQLSMNGHGVFIFGLSTVASNITKLLQERGEDISLFDFIVLHQANELLNDSIVRKIGGKKQKAPSSLYNFGNTSCATIPVTMISQIKNQLETEKLKLLLSGFGVGLSWGNVILTTDKVVCTDMIYL